MKNSRLLFEPLPSKKSVVFEEDKVKGWHLNLLKHDILNGEEVLALSNHDYLKQMSQETINSLNDFKGLPPYCGLGRPLLDLYANPKQKPDQYISLLGKRVVPLFNIIEDLQFSKSDPKSSYTRNIRFMEAMNTSLLMNHLLLLEIEKQLKPENREKLNSKAGFYLESMRGLVNYNNRLNEKLLTDLKHAQKEKKLIDADQASSDLLKLAHGMYSLSFMAKGVTENKKAEWPGTKTYDLNLLEKELSDSKHGNPELLSQLKNFRKEPLAKDPDAQKPFVYPAAH